MADIDALNPLGPEHLAQINDALEKVKVGLAAVEKAKRAGIDVSQAEATLNDSERRLKAVKQVYFPGQ